MLRMIIFLMVLFLTGCAGPSTRVLVQEEYKKYYQEMDEQVVLEEANPFYIHELISHMTSGSRPGGSREETETARMLQQYLQDYGYEVTRQRFRLWDGKDSNEVTGTNVVAVRSADAADADILIIGTHHDTEKESPGANDSASGVAVWLETARLVAELPTDTELRFVSFSGSEDGWLGSRHYAESLSEKEKKRVIGAIQLDACASKEFSELILGTADGNETLLGELLQQEFWSEHREALAYGVIQDSDACSLHQGRIPSVSLRQKRDSYVMNTPLDQMDTVDIERITDITNSLSRVIADIMAVDSPSMRAKSHYVNDLRDSAYIQHREDVNVFGTAQKELDGRFRQMGIRISSHEQDGHTIEDYQYQMKWFDVDQIILSNYYFLDGALDSITLDADGAGIDLQDMTERLVSWYGAPDMEKSGPNGVEYVWHIPAFNLSVTLTETTDGYDVEMRDHHPEAVILGRCDQNGDLDGIREGDLLRCRKASYKLNSLIPGAWRNWIENVIFYADGIRGTDGYLTYETKDHGSLSADLHLNLDKLLNDRAEWINETSAEKQMLHLLGELLEKQDIDGTASQFYEEFLEDADFADTFVYFVLADKPKGQTGMWNDRINFFYSSADMIAVRKEIRQNLRLHD